MKKYICSRKGSMYEETSFTSIIILFLLVMVIIIFSISEFKENKIHADRKAIITNIEKWEFCIENKNKIQKIIRGDNKKTFFVKINGNLYKIKEYNNYKLYRIQE